LRRRVNSNVTRLHAVKLLKPHKRMSSSQSQRVGDYTSIPFEIFIAAFSILPFFVLAYFYSVLPDRVPLFMKLNGEVASWAEKSVLSVFRVPLMAVVTQVVCLLMKYGTVQSSAVAPLEIAVEQTKLQEHYLSLNAGLWDWFRWTVAFKMSAEFLNTIFLSLERFKVFSRPTFIITAIAALLGVAGALFYVYRLLVVRREMKEKFGDLNVQKPVDARHVHGGVLYFNPSDSALFVSKYVFNFANKWAWVFIACIIAYPLLVFLPS
jgi:uncharacterized membrane protein